MTSVLRIDLRCDTFACTTVNSSVRAVAVLGATLTYQQFSLRVEVQWRGAQCSGMRSAVQRAAHSNITVWYGMVWYGQWCLSAGDSVER